MKNAKIDKQTENIIMNQIAGKAQKKNGVVGKWSEYNSFIQSDDIELILY